MRGPTLEIMVHEQSSCLHHHAMHGYCCIVHNMESNTSSYTSQDFYTKFLINNNSILIVDSCVKHISHVCIIIIIIIIVNQALV